MKIRFGPALAICLALSSRALGPAKADPWENLRCVTRHRAYTFFDRESNCTTGQILTVTDQSVTIKPPQGNNITVERRNVVRVTDWNGRNNVIYSAKSSWSDVEAINTKASVNVLTKNGRVCQGKVVSTSDTGITLMHSNCDINLAKEDIAQVYRVRSKPMSEGAERSAQELFVVDPRLWPYLLNISAKISVRLYDSSVPEDDSPVQCKNKP
jgi:preprotein translocase subunit YajC